MSAIRRPAAFATCMAAAALLLSGCATQSPQPFPSTPRVIERAPQV